MEYQGGTGGTGGTGGRLDENGYEGRAHIVDLRKGMRWVGAVILLPTYVYGWR